MMKLDAVDLRILKAIQRDGRITKLALAEKVGLSATPCWVRLQKLEKAGVVSGYHARLNLRKIAPVANVLMEVTLANHRQADFDRFERAVTAIPEIIACHNVSGRYDFLLEVLAKDLESFGEFAREVLQTLPAVKEIYSSFSFKSVKPLRQIPVQE